jgi:NAD(P)H-hydrate epimerase
LRGDAAANYSILKHTNIPISAGDQLEKRCTAAWIVDALLGTGAQGDPRPPFDAAIDWINSHSANSRVLAVDVPSGLDCDSGLPTAHTVRADHTCTFGAMKSGYIKATANAFTGHVHVCGIGVPPQLIADVRDACRT